MSPLCEDGGERKEGSPMYLRMVGQKERKRNKEQLHAAGPVLCAHWQWQHQAQCYVTVGTFARRGLSSTAKTLRSLSGVLGSEY